MRKAQILIYPYSRRIRPFIVYQNLLKDMEICAVVSPKGWGLEGDTITSFEKEFTVTTDFENQLLDCDKVWFCEDGDHELPVNILKEKLLIALSSEKEIIFTRREQFEDINIGPSFSREESLDKEVSPIFRMNLINLEIPVVAVVGNHSNCDRLEVQLALRYEFLKRGYEVTSVCSSYASELYDMHKIPDFMMNPLITSSDKSIMFTQYLKLITDNDKSEIVIIEIPGKVSTYEKGMHVLDDRGINEVCSTVDIDFTVLCSIYIENILEELQIEKEMLNRKFFLNIDAFHIAPSLKSESDKYNDIQTELSIELDEEFLYNRIPELDKENVLNLRKYKNVQRLTERIINILS